MIDSSTPDALMLRPVPLTSVRERDGRPYTRFADVEEEIAEVLQSDRSGAMLLEAPSRWKTQTLVYFARNGGKRRELTGRLVREVMTRAGKIVALNCRGFSPTDVDEIAGEVRTHLVKLILTETPTRMSEYLEIDFSGSVASQTTKQRAKLKDKPKPRMVASASTTMNDLDPLDSLVDKAAISALDELIRKTSPPIRHSLASSTHPKASQSRPSNATRNVRDASIMRMCCGCDHGPTGRLICASFRSSGRRSNG